MAPRVTGLVAAVSVALILGGCTSDSPRVQQSTSTVSPTVTSTPVTPTPTALPAVSPIDEVIAVLRVQDVDIGEIETQSYFSGDLPNASVQVGDDGWLHITEYPQEFFAEVEAASKREDERVVLNPDDFGYGLTPEERGGYLFLLGPTMIQYHGDDPRVPETLRNFGARLFSGGTMPLTGGVDSLKEIFGTRGFTVTEPDLFVLGLEMPTGHRSKFFYANGEAVHVWAYSGDPRIVGGRLDELPRIISQDGMSYEQVDEVIPFDWQGIPHFYHQGGAVALYIGDEQEIINTLRDIAGREFAGGDLSEPYPVTTDSLKSQLEQLGISVDPIGTAPENSPFRSPGELWTLNGEPAEVFIFEGPSWRPFGARFEDRSGLWPSTPYLFERENAAVFYVGEDESVIAALERTFGWNEMSVGVPPAVRMGTAAGEHELAPIIDVQVYSARPEKSRYVALVTAEGGGCVYYDHYTLVRDENTFKIQVFNRDSATAWQPNDDGVQLGCPSIGRHHRIYVPLNGDLFVGQEYAVHVNGDEWTKFTAD